MNLQTAPQETESIAHTIIQSVQNRTGGTIRDLRVDFVDGQVFISGRTSTYYNKQIATHAALSVLNEVPLCNEIEVL